MVNLSRPLLVVLGAAVLAGAFFLARSIADGGADDSVTGTGSADASSSRSEREKAAPAWEAFLVKDAQPVPRPRLVAEHPPQNPFDRGLARIRLAELNLRLEGIGRGGEAGAVALISGDRLHVGDTIDIFRVVSIRNAAVSLEGPSGVRIDLAPRPPDETPEPEPAGGAAAEPDWQKALEAADKRRPKPEPARPRDRDDIR